MDLRSNGLCGAIHGANSASRMRTAVVIPAKTTILDDRKLCTRSLSRRAARRFRNGPGAEAACSLLTLTTPPSARQADQANAWIDKGIKQVDDEIDQHEYESHQQQI